MSESRFDKIVEVRSVKAIEEHGALPPDKLAVILRDEHGVSMISTPQGQPAMNTSDLNEILNESKYLEQNGYGKWHIKGEKLLSEEDKYWRERPHDDVMELANNVVSNVKNDDSLNMINAFDQLTATLVTNGITNVSEREIGTALEIASKEQDYKLGYIEGRNYPTEKQ